MYVNIGERSNRLSWKRKDLKRNARSTIKKNFINTIIVCFIVSIIAANYRASSNIIVRPNSDNFSIFHLPTMSENIEHTVSSILEIRPNGDTRLDKSIHKAENTIESEIGRLQRKFNLRNATEGVIATILNNSNGSKSFIIGIINSVNKFVFDNKILEGTIVAVSSVVMFLFWYFIQNILIVGEARFFLETKNYPDTDVTTLLFIYRIRRTVHVGFIMFMRFVFNFLWYFTIVGGFIKHYSYMMIPYILAENPNISRKEAFKLSKLMMKGNKWKTFVMDLSFIHWHLLSVLTMGIFRFAYVNPYISATRSELYYSLRAQLIEERNPQAVYFNDKHLLAVPNGIESYPYSLYPIPEAEKQSWVKLDYDRDYRLTSLIYIFFTACFIGWCWEVLIFLFKAGGFVNRGTLYGPWLPIYGTGSVLLLLVLKPFIKRPIVFFPSAFVLCGILEYFASWVLEKLFNQYWWNYSTTFGNINGRVCLEGLLFFSAGAGLVVYVIAPLVDEFVSRIPIKAKQTICTVLVLMFVSDMIFSFTKPNNAEGSFSKSGNPIPQEPKVVSIIPNKKEGA